MRSSLKWKQRLAELEKMIGKMRGKRLPDLHWSFHCILRGVCAGELGGGVQPRLAYNQPTVTAIFIRVLDYKLCCVCVVGVCGCVCTCTWRPESASGADPQISPPSAFEIVSH